MEKCCFEKHTRTHRFDEYLDVMNSGKKRREWSGTREYLSHPIREKDDRRLVFLEKFAQYVESWHNAEAAPKATSPRFISRELAYDLILSCRGFVAFTRHMLDLGMDGIIPRVFNQDPVEGHFSRLRDGQHAHMTVAELPSRQAAAAAEYAQSSSRGNCTDGEVYSTVSQGAVKRSREAVKRHKVAVRAEGAALAASFGIPVPDTDSD